MAAQPDFWGDISPVPPRTPLTIMKEQAALLGRKTRNLVEAHVETHFNAPSGTLSHLFHLVVPTFDNYKYLLFAVEHRSTEIYPMRIRYGGNSSSTDEEELPSKKHAKESRSISTEEEFVQWLKGKLSSAETTRIVGNLLAQVTS